MRFTFKTKKATGRYKSFYPDQHLIKLKRKVVGRITDDKPHKIRFSVKKEDPANSNNPNCEWHWVTLKKEFDSINEAKEFLNAHIEAILDKFELYSTDD